MHDNVWCPWCRRWVAAVTHIGPGYYCRHCQGNLGMTEADIRNRRPSAAGSVPVPDDQAPQGVLPL